MPQDTSIIRIIKVGHCTNLSGKSNLGYHIGCTSGSEIVIRVATNDGGGFFSTEWVSLKAIQAALEKAPGPVSSNTLFPLFKGKSANTPGFLFAVLLTEGLVQRDEENPRCYIVMPADSFQAEVDLLMASGVDLKVKEPAMPSINKVATQNPETPAKKLASKSTRKNSQSEAYKA